MRLSRPHTRRIRPRLTRRPTDRLHDDLFQERFDTPISELRSVDVAGATSCRGDCCAEIGTKARQPHNSQRTRYNRCCKRIKATRLEWLPKLNMAKSCPAILVTWAAFVWATSITAGDEFQPLYDQAELRGPANAMSKRVGIEREPHHTHDAGGIKFVVAGDRIDIGVKDGEEPRRVRSLDGRKLRLLGTARRIALFAAENTDENLASNPYLRAEILRCDLDTASWLPGWRFENTDDAPPAAIGPALGSVLANEESVIVLTYDKPSGIVVQSGPLRTAETTSYTVTCYRAREDAAKWSKTFVWQTGRSPDVMLNRETSRAIDPGIEPLSWVDDEFHGPSILVCAGGKQELRCLAAEDGEERWRIARLWEFERGFIGPSVFEHFVDRFGIDYTDVSLAADADVENESDREQQDKARKRLSEARKRFEDDFDGTIAAGPVFVPDKFWGHIFIAAAQRRREEGWQDLGGLAKCTVYELEADTGEVIAATALPRMVTGRPLMATRGALTWSCDRGCLVRLHHSEFDFSTGFFGPGAGAVNDALCRVAWYREYNMRIPACWFWADPPDGVAAFDKEHLYRPAAAYIEDKDKPVYCFVINVVDLQSGIDHDLTLTIPYRGDFPMPENGYADFGSHTRATQPHLISIDSISVDGNSLRVVMQRPDGKRTDAALKFELPTE